MKQNKNNSNLQKVIESYFPESKKLNSDDSRIHSIYKLNDNFILTKYKVGYYDGEFILYSITNNEVQIKNKDLYYLLQLARKE